MANRGPSGSEQKKEEKKPKLPHYRGDMIFGGFVTCWFLGLAIHMQTDVPLLGFERAVLSTVKTDGSNPGGFPFPTPEWTMNNQWIPCAATLFYFTLMIHGPEKMKNRGRPTWLKPAVFCWNIFLSLGSSWGAWRLTTDTWNTWRTQASSAYDIICEDASRGRGHKHPLAVLWLMLFCYSKIPEMIDTFFLIVGKKSVIFLHWFHHSSVMWFCWLAWAHHVPMGIPFAMMNLTVHSIMYAWYALAAANNWLGTGLKPTRTFSQTVTILQIVQMILGAGVTFFVMMQDPKDCHNDRTVILMGLAMYSVYLILFVHFFCRAYCRKKKPLLKKPEFVADAHLFKCDKCGTETPHKKTLKRCKGSQSQLRGATPPKGNKRLS